MMKMFLSLHLIYISLCMIFLNHPLSLGLFILIQTLILCLLSGMFIYSYWFSYILFLTFMGGLLVLFIYISSIASNELFISSFKLMKNYFIIMMILLIFFISMIYNNNLYLFNIFMNSDMNKFFNMFFFINMENNVNLAKLYNEQTYLLMMMLIIYLFITLIAVIKITNIFFGPLRSFN